jgi:hypothetical protein
MVVEDTHMSETSKASQPDGESPPPASALSPTAWELTTVDGKTFGPVTFDTVARG